MTGLDRFRNRVANNTDTPSQPSAPNAHSAADELARLSGIQPNNTPPAQNVNPFPSATPPSTDKNILGNIRNKLIDGNQNTPPPAQTPVQPTGTNVPTIANRVVTSADTQVLSAHSESILRQEYEKTVREEQERANMLNERRNIMGNYKVNNQENEPAQPMASQLAQPMDAPPPQPMVAPPPSALDEIIPQKPDMPRAPQMPMAKPKKPGLFKRFFGKGDDDDDLADQPMKKPGEEENGMPVMKDPEKDWVVRPSFENKDDPLLGCLMILCKMLNRSTTREALVAELPVGTGVMSPDVFIRSAEREEISAKLVRRKPSSISNLVVPCVLLLEAKRAAILTEIKHGKYVSLVFPDSDGGEAQIDWKQFEKAYTGYAIFARPRFRYDKRTADRELVPKSRGWFWGTVAHLWPIYSEVLVASFLINVMMVISPLFMSNVIDRVVPHLAFETLWVLAIGAIIAMLFQLVLLQIRTYMTELAGKAIHTRLSARVFQQVMGLKMSERGDSTGAMTEKVGGIGAVHNFFTAQTALTIIDFPFSILFLVMCFVLAGPIALVPTAVMVFLLLVSILFTPIQRRLSKKEKKERQHGRAVMVEAIYGMETVKSSGAEGRLQNDWELNQEESSNTRMKNSHANALVMNIMMCAMQVNMVLIAVFGVYMIKDNALTIGGLMAANMMSSRALGPMMRITGIAMRFHGSIVSLRQIDEIMKKEVERPIGSQFIHRDRFKGSLEFKNVSFAYPDNSDTEKREPGAPPKDSSNKALDGVSFAIESGEKVGIIGRIGSGKSTLERLILGLYHVKEGSILIDGIDIRQIDPAELRRNVGTVPQEVFLFYGSIRDNIVVHAPYADDDMILRAAHIAGVDEFASRHPKGLDMQVGEKGQNLSGGQRQAVSVARAFLIDPPIVLLDEPTSAMDTTSENRFKARLESLMGDRTLILVTHRYSLLTLVSRLIVMDNGKIVADGPKDRVLEALKNGTIRSVEI